jgi:hypothetical protein
MADDASTVYTVNIRAVDDGASSAFQGIAAEGNTASTSLEQQSARMSAAFDQMAGGIETGATALSNALLGISAKIEGLGTTLAGLDAKLSTLSGSFDSTRSASSQLDAALGGIGKAAVGAGDKAATLGDKLSGAGHAASDLAGDSGSASKQLDTLAGRLGAAEKNAAPLAGALGRASTEAGNLRDTATPLADALARVATQAGRLDDVLPGIAPDMAKIGTNAKGAADGLNAEADAAGRAAKTNNDLADAQGRVDATRPKGGTYAAGGSSSHTSGGGLGHGTASVSHAALMAGGGLDVLGLGSIVEGGKYDAAFQAAGANALMAQSVIKDIEKSALPVFMANNQSYTDLATAYQRAGEQFQQKKGESDKQYATDLTSIVTESLKSAVATHGELPEIAQGLSKVIFDFGLKANQSQQAMDILHAIGGQGGNMSVTDLSQYFGKPAATGSQLGFSLPQVGGLFDVLSKQFGPAQSATYLSGLFQHILSQSTGSEKELQSMGLSKEFSQQGAEQAGPYKLITDLWNAAQAKSARSGGKVSVGDIIQAVIPGQRGGLALDSLMQHGHLGMAETATRTLGGSLGQDASALGSGSHAGVYGITTTQYQQMLKQVSTQFGVMENEAKGVAVEIGNVLAPAFGKLEGPIKAGVDAIKGFVSSHRTLVTDIGEGALALTGLGLGLKAISLFANPFALVAAGIVGIGIAADTAYTKSKPFHDLVNTVAGDVKSGAGDFLSGLTGGAQDASKHLAGTHSQLALVKGSMGQAVPAPEMSGLAQAGANVRQFAQGFGSSFMKDIVGDEPAFNAFVKDVKGGFKEIGNALGVFGGSTTSAKGKGSELAGVLSSSLRIAAETLGPAFKEAANVVSTAIKIIHDVMGPVKTVVNDVAGAFGLMGKGGKDAKGPLDALAPIVGKFGTDLFVAAAGFKALNAGWTAVTTGISAVKGGLQDIATGIGSTMNFIKGVPGMVSSAVSAIGDFTAAVWKNITAFGSWAAAQVSAVAQSVKSAAESAAAWVASSAKTVGALVAQGAQWVVMQAKTALATLATWAQTAAQTALDFVMDANPIGLVVIAIAALIGGLVLAYNKVGFFHDAVDAMGSMVKHVASAALPLLSDAVHAVAGFVGDAVGFIKDHWQLLLAIFLGPIGLVIDLFVKFHGQILREAEAIWHDVAGAFTSLWNDLTGIVGKLISDVVGFFTGLANQLVGHSIIPDMITSIITWFKGLPGEVLGFIGGMVTSVTGAFGTLATNVMGKLGDLLGMIGGWGTTLATNFLNMAHKAMSDMISGIGDKAGELKDALVNAVKGAVDAAGSFVQSHNPFDWLSSHIPGMGSGSSSGAGTPVAASGGGNIFGSTLFGMPQFSSTPGPASWAGIPNAVGHTDIQAPVNTPFYLPKGTYTFVSQTQLLNAGNEEIWKTKGGGLFDFMHMLTMPAFVPNQQYKGGTYLGRSGGVPGEAGVTRVDSTAQHLHVGYDAQAYADIRAATGGVGFTPGALTGPYPPGYAPSGYGSGGAGTGQGPSGSSASQVYALAQALASLTHTGATPVGSYGEAQQVMSNVGGSVIPQLYQQIEALPDSLRTKFLTPLEAVAAKWSDYNKDFSTRQTAIYTHFTQQVNAAQHTYTERLQGLNQQDAETRRHYLADAGITDAANQQKFNEQMGATLASDAEARRHLLADANIKATAQSETALLHQSDIYQKANNAQSALADRVSAEQKKAADAGDKLTGTQIKANADAANKIKQTQDQATAKLASALGISTDSARKMLNENVQHMATTQQQGLDKLVAEHVITQQQSQKIGDEYLKHLSVNQEDALGKLKQQETDAINRAKAVRDSSLRTLQASLEKHAGAVQASVNNLEAKLAAGTDSAAMWKAIVSDAGKGIANDLASVAFGILTGKPQTTTTGLTPAQQQANLALGGTAFSPTTTTTSVSQQMAPMAQAIAQQQLASQRYASIMAQATEQTDLFAGNLSDASSQLGTRIAYLTSEINAQLVAGEGLNQKQLTQVERLTAQQAKWGAVQANLTALIAVGTGDLAGFSSALATVSGYLTNEVYAGLVKGQGINETLLTSVVHLAGEQAQAAVVQSAFAGLVSLGTGDLAGFSSSLGTVSTYLTNQVYAGLVAGQGVNQQYLAQIEQITQTQREVQDVQDGFNAVVLASTGNLSDLSTALGALSKDTLTEWEGAVSKGAGAQNAYTAQLVTEAQAQLALTEAQTRESVVLGLLTGNASQLAQGLGGLLTAATDKLSFFTDMIGRTATFATAAAGNIGTLATNALAAAGNLGSFSTIVSALTGVVGQLDDAIQTQFLRTGAFDPSQLAAYGQAQAQVTGTSWDTVAVKLKEAQTTSDLVGYQSALTTEIQLQTAVVGKYIAAGTQSTDAGVRATAMLTGLQAESDGLANAFKTSTITATSSAADVAAANAATAQTNQALTTYRAGTDFATAALAGNTIAITASTTASQDLQTSFQSTQKDVSDLGTAFLGMGQQLQTAGEQLQSFVVQLTKGLSVSDMTINAGSVTVSGSGTGGGLGGVTSPGGLNTFTGPHALGTGGSSGGGSAYNYLAASSAGLTAGTWTASGYYVAYDTTNHLRTYAPGDTLPTGYVVGVANQLYPPGTDPSAPMVTGTPPASSNATYSAPGGSLPTPYPVVTSTTGTTATSTDLSPPQPEAPSTYTPGVASASGAGTLGGSTDGSASAMLTAATGGTYSGRLDASGNWIPGSGPLAPSTGYRPNVPFTNTGGLPLGPHGETMGGTVNLNGVVVPYGPNGLEVPDAWRTQTSNGVTSEETSAQWYFNQLHQTSEMLNQFYSAGLEQKPDATTGLYSGERLTPAQQNWNSFIQANGGYGTTASGWKIIGPGQFQSLTPNPPNADGTITYTVENRGWDASKGQFDGFPIFNANGINAGYPGGALGAMAQWMPAYGSGGGSGVAGTLSQIAANTAQAAASGSQTATNTGTIASNTATANQAAQDLLTLLQQAYAAGKTQQASGGMGQYSDFESFLTNIGMHGLANLAGAGM